ncbi:hypothetical protein D3C80_1926940 [compost metagenome]
MLPFCSICAADASPILICTPSPLVRIMLAPLAVPVIPSEPSVAPSAPVKVVFTDFNVVVSQPSSLISKLRGTEVPAPLLAFKATLET